MFLKKEILKKKPTTKRKMHYIYASLDTLL